MQSSWSHYPQLLSILHDRYPGLFWHMRVTIYLKVTWGASMQCSYCCQTSLWHWFLNTFITVLSILEIICFTVALITCSFWAVPVLIELHKVFKVNKTPQIFCCLSAITNTNDFIYSRQQRKWILSRLLSSETTKTLIKSQLYGSVR